MPKKQTISSARNQNPAVDFYFKKHTRWQPELDQLRAIALDCGLNEELKWGTPCYTFRTGPDGKQERKVVLLHVFKEYCALLFFKGALLKDPKKILIQQTENVQAARQARFTKESAIPKQAKTLKAYIYEAMELEEAGKKVALKPVQQFAMPDELNAQLEKNKAFKKAFEALTPGRQRGYLLFFNSPKQAKTREARIAKYRAHILNGKGLNDE